MALFTSLTRRLAEGVLVALDNVSGGPPLGRHRAVHFVNETEVDLPEEELGEEFADKENDWEDEDSEEAEKGM